MMQPAPIHVQFVRILEADANQDHPLFMEEWEKASAINIDWGHVQTFSFLLEGTTTNDFVIRLDSDHELKGVVQIFWDEERVYI